MSKHKEDFKEFEEESTKELVEEGTEKEEQEEQEGTPQEVVMEDKQKNYLDQLVRLQAEFENYRKRTEKEKPLFIEFGKTEVIKNLLPLYDTLLKAKGELLKDNVDVKHVKQGLKMILEEFEKSFKTEGVSFIDAVGKPYDPNSEEVITTVPCQKKDDGLVLQEIASGVLLNGKVIRSAQVIVGKAEEGKERNKEETTKEKEVNED